MHTSLPTLVRVQLAEGPLQVHLLALTHQEVEIGEGELHVIRAADLVGGGAVKLFWVAFMQCSHHLLVDHVRHVGGDLPGLVAVCLGVEPIHMSQ